MSFSTTILETVKERPVISFLLAVGIAQAGVGLYDLANNYEVSGVVERASMVQGSLVVTFEDQANAVVFRNSDDFDIPELGSEATIVAGRPLYHRLGGEGAPHIGRGIR